MGRVKLKLKRLENNTCRQTTFSKRKNGLIKKANELSILCDIDIVLLMFSPSGKPTLFKGQNSSIEDMILKFAQLTPHERAKRKLESLEALKRAFKKLDHDVNLEEFFGPSYQSIEDLTDQVNSLRTQLSEVHKRLSYWSNLDKIGNTVHLGQMEDSLKESLNRIRTHKENLVKQQQLAIQCANEFENGMHVPFSLGIEQQFQPLSWILDGHSQHITLSKDLNLFSHRNTECSTGTSFENYSGYFGVSEKVDISRVGHESSSLGELSTTESLRLQMCEQQHPCPSYNFNLLCDNKAFQPPAQPNMQESTSNFCFDENFEFPQSGYNLSHHGWTSTSGSYTLEMFDEKLFPQQQYSSDDLVASDLDHMYVRGTHHPGVTN